MKKTRKEYDLGSITCIYCKQNREPSREHVLQRSLGGDLVRRFVCSTCNNCFSIIDQSLADRSFVALSRVAQTPASAFKAVLGALVTQYDPDRDIYVEMQVRNEFTSVALAQLHLRAGGQGTVIGSSKADLIKFVEFIDARVKNNTLESLHVFIGIPGCTCSSAALVMKKSGEGYVRLPTKEDERWFYSLIKLNWPVLREKILQNPATPRYQDNSEIALHFNYPPNDVNRAVAKTAFNTLASKIGSRILDTALDPLREYILGDLHLSQPSGPDEIAVDSRFVFEIPPDQQQLHLSDEHSVVLAYSDPSLIAFVTLYGEHLFLVKFPGITGLVLDELSGHSFTRNRAGNADLDFCSIAARLLEKNPQRFGLVPAVANRMASLLRGKI